MGQAGFNHKVVWPVKLIAYVLLFYVLPTLILRVLSLGGDWAGASVMVGCMWVLVVIVQRIFGERWACRNRVRELIAVSKRLNMEFSLSDPFDIPGTHRRCHDFNQGRARRAFNIIHGRVGDCDVRTCDYRYETSSGDSPSFCTASFVILDTPYSFPYLIVRPESSRDRMAAVVSESDVSFESEEFNRRFYVQSDDKKFAYGVIHPRIMELLLSGPEQTIELVHRSVIIHAGSVYEPQEFAQGIMFVRQFVELFPDYLQKQLRSAQEVT